MDWSDVRNQPEGPRRKAAIAAWLQSLYPPDDLPVLVGGSAVEIYTDGAYVSGDLDFVGHVPNRVALALQQVGFVHRGRHWIHEPEQIFLEFPGSSPRPGERTHTVAGPFGAILLISAEDLIVDRLLSLVFWRAREDGINAALVYLRRGTTLERARLRERAEQEGVASALRSLEALFAGNAEPTAAEMERFLEDSMRGMTS